MKFFMKKILVFMILVTIVLGRCSFLVHEDGKPEKVDNEPHLIEGLTQCV